MMTGIELNSLDYAVITIMSLSVVFGLLRGFVGSVLSFAGWVASIYVSYVLLPNTKGLYSSAISNPAVATVVGYMTSLLICLIGFGLLNLVITKSVGLLRGGLFDRLLGIIFGALRGGAIISALYLGFVISWNMMNNKQGVLDEDKDSYPNLIKTAYTYDYMVVGKEILVDLLPANVDSSLADLNKKFGAVKGVMPDYMTTPTAHDNLPAEGGTVNIVDEEVSNLIQDEMDKFFPGDGGNEVSTDKQ